MEKNLAMIKKSLGIGIILFYCLFFAVQVQAQTVETCHCFCQSKGGAVERGMRTVEKCREECGTDYLTCASVPRAFPENNIRCFDSSYCEGQNGIWAAEQTPACMPGYRYCYPKASQVPISLIVPIGETDAVADVGDYISAIYTWLLGAALTVAIVMVMIGGLQYVISAGGGKAKEAKDRISNAVIGFVLLLFAYVILFTVNPNLLDLTMPPIPMVKTVAFVGEGSSCEGLAEQGYTIEKAKGLMICGGIGKIVKAPEGIKVTDGATCRYMKCGNQDERCILVGDKGLCLECADIYPNNLHNIPPSSAMCGSFDRPVRIDKKNNPKDGNRCFYSTDANVMTLYGVDINLPNLATGGDLITGSCVSLPIDCSKINTCEDYDDLVTKSFKGDVKLDDLEPEYYPGPGESDIDIEEICLSNPCRATTEGIREGLKKGCHFEAGISSLVADCETPK
ncbi:pilin [Patescibacteria group bacterium]|nr:pilin [Patescibacteria group bacterium]MBU1705526.1 pilin [Patescibacteria group bacterium]